ncbi:hypothetical protein niasHT_037902 [Heterodera trifolii]|uniref:Uncharacterized protein n=1 Tax=Heterodera trifolii TaxID=157864 RepID=A0ABD2IN96_9BILA
MRVRHLFMDKLEEADLFNEQNVARICIHEICVVPDPDGDYDGYTASEPRAESTRSQMMAQIACYYGACWCGGQPNHPQCTKAGQADPGRG